MVNTIDRIVNVSGNVVDTINFKNNPDSLATTRAKLEVLIGRAFMASANRAQNSRALENLLKKVENLGEKNAGFFPSSAGNKPITDIDMDRLGVANSHRTYFVNGGIPLFKKLTSEEIGFSSLGVAFAMGQSAWESGYGNETDINKKVKANNFWGMKFKGKVISYSSFESGFDAWQTMMTDRFKGAYDLLKEDFTISELEQEINYGDFSYDPLTKGEYVKKMLTNSGNVLKRMIIVLEEQRTELRNQATETLKDENGNKRDFKSLTNEEKSAYNNTINNINELSGMIYKIKQSIKAIEDTLSLGKTNNNTNKQKK